VNIIITQTYVAGIFAQWNDAQGYLANRPDHVKGFTHINTDLTYPFYLLETIDGWFLGFQTEAEARAQPNGLILFTIEEDYRPQQPWLDFMGGLEHDHIDQDEEALRRADAGWTADGSTHVD
jgi:hypothetical protein